MYQLYLHKPFKIRVMEIFKYMAVFDRSYDEIEDLCGEACKVYDLVFLSNTELRRKQKENIAFETKNEIYFECILQTNPL